MKKQLIIPFAFTCLFFSACSMDEIPQASVDKETVFSNEKEVFSRQAGPLA